MNIGLHHLLENYKLSRLEQPEYIIIKSSKFRRFVNRFIYVIGIFSIIILLPQLFSILLFKDAQGVSLMTWMGFLVNSIFWLFYGIIHREKPIIITNSGALIVDGLVIASVIYFRHGLVF